MERALVNDLYTTEKTVGLTEPKDLIENYESAKTHVSGKNKNVAWKSYTKRFAYTASSLLGGGLGYVGGSTSTLVWELYKGIYNLPQLNPLEIGRHAIYNGGIAAAIGLVVGPIMLKCLESSTFSFFGWIFNGIASIFKK